LQDISDFKCVSEFSPPEAQIEEYEDEEIRDVYLGGSSGEIQWRNNIVIPSLR
jgi:hypothetical protein